jgi:hypothetical protein
MRVRRVMVNDEVFIRCHCVQANAPFIDFAIGFGDVVGDPGLNILNITFVRRPKVRFVARDARYE